VSVWSDADETTAIMRQRQREILPTGMPTNVDVVRRVLDAFNSGDLEAMLAMHDRGRARGSAIDIDQPFAMLFKVRRGKLVFGQTFADPDEALEAARTDRVSRSEQPT
jgi:ketosteroid isomerase-like protein